MKFIFSIYLFSICISSIAQKQFVLDEHAELRTVAATFTSIKVSSAIQLYLSMGANEAVATSATNQVYRDGIKLEVVNGELNIYYDGPNKWASNNNGLKVYVAYKNLVQLTISSASNVVIAGIMNLPMLHVKLSGASNLKGQVNINNLTLRCSAASDVQLTGIVKNLIIESSGASDVHAYGIVADTAIIKTSGASDVQLTVNHVLTAVASGASNIFYKGNPTLKNQQNSGASTIAKQN